MLYFTSTQELLDPLKLFTRTLIAGNNNRQHRNEIWHIIVKLLSLGIITKGKHDEYAQKYLI